MRSVAIILFACVLFCAQAKVHWCGGFGGDWKRNFNVVQGPNNDDIFSVVNDPQEGPVLQVGYPANKKGGGIGFDAKPTGLKEGGKTKLCLRYRLYFEPNFDWGRGGKLPGLIGNIPGPKVPCSGGRHSTSCFSARYMWYYMKQDKRATGYVYGYTPGKCTEGPNVDCNEQYGNALGKNIFFFRTGWQTLTYEVKLNTVGKSDGYFKVWFDNNSNYNKPTYTYDNTVIRTNPNVLITAINVNSFYGGSDDTWAPSRPTHTRFGGFAIADDCSELLGNFKCSANPARASSVDAQTYGGDQTSPAKNVPMIVGIAVGAAVFVIMVVVVVVVVLRRRATETI